MSVEYTTKAVPQHPREAGVPGTGDRQQRTIIASMHVLQSAIPQVLRSTDFSGKVLFVVLMVGQQHVTLFST